MSETRSLFQRASAPARRRIVWELLLRSARRKGIDRSALGRVEEYLAHTFRLTRATPAHPLQRPRNYFPGLSAQPWYDPAAFRWAKQLEGAFETILEELATVRGGSAAIARNPNGARSAGDRTREHPLDIPIEGRWDVFYFHVIGRRHEQNHQLCPRTAALLDTIPDLCEAGISYFSVLKAGTHITAHTAPNNLRIRGQLGLIVPPGGRIRVGSEERTWERGRCMVFDGSFDHEVWASEEGDRTVLIVDTWHPELTSEERWALAELNNYSRETRRYWKETLRVSAERASAAQATSA